MTKNTMFVHLHGHSHFSLLSALGKPDAIMDKALELGMDSVAITDYGNMYGTIEFFIHAQKKGIKPLIGVEIVLVPDVENKPPKELQLNIVLLAKNTTGYKNLVEMVSAANLDAFYQKARIDYQMLTDRSEGLIGFMGGQNSLLGGMILNRDEDKKLIDTIDRFKDIFGRDGFLLEVIAQDYELEPMNKRINDKILELGPKTNTVMIVNNNFHYINSHEKDAYEALLCIRNQQLIYDPNRQRIPGDRSIWDEDMMRKILKTNGLDDKLIDQLIDTNVQIAKDLKPEIPIGTIHFPKYLPDPDIAKIYEKVKDDLILEE